MYRKYLTLYLYVEGYDSDVAFEIKLDYSTKTYTKPIRRRQGVKPHQKEYDEEKQLVFSELVPDVSLKVLYYSSLELLIYRKEIDPHCILVIIIFRPSVTRNTKSAPKLRNDRRVENNSKGGGKGKKLAQVKVGLIIEVGLIK